MKRNALKNSRRNFIHSAMGGFGGAILSKEFGSLKWEPKSIDTLVQPHEGNRDEEYWKMVRRQFAMPDHLIMVNAANLCPSPFVVNQAIRSYAGNLETDVSFQNRNRFNEVRQKALGLLAQYLGADKDEVGITRNTSEGNNIVVNGLDFQRGDEIIVWDQNHPTNNIAWEQRARREGFKIVQVSTPANPKTREELLDTFSSAVTNRTRLIAFSHISNVSGIALPAKEICQMASQRGILTLIDGAQSFGFRQVRLHELGCDFYTGSAHKWLMGPKETGVLYVRGDLIDRVWPSVISAGWKEDWKTVDEKLCVLGQRDDAAISALVETVNFHFEIGPKHVEERVYQLVTHLKNGLSASFDGLSFVTPIEKDLSGGVLIFKIPGKDSVAVFEQLYDQFGIAGAPAGGIRLSPNIYNTLEEMDLILEALHKV